MAQARCEQIAEIIRDEELTVVEYEGWSSVVPPLGPPLASLGPEHVIYIDGFSNALMPGLRTSIVRIPNQMMPSILATRHAILLSTPSLLSEIATHWIMSGVAERLANAVVQKNVSRMKLAREILGPKVQNTPVASPFIWLPVAPFKDAHSFTQAAEDVGVNVLPAERFAIGQKIPPFVRIALSRDTRSQGPKHARRVTIHLAAGCSVQGCP